MIDSTRQSIVRPMARRILSDDDRARGQRIAHVRQEVLGLGQEALSERLNVSRGAVGNWELGHGVHADNLEKLADIANVSFAWLRTGAGQMTSNQDAALENAKALLRGAFAKHNQDGKLSESAIEGAIDRIPALRRNLVPLPKREDASRLVPVYASAEGGSGSMVLHDGPTEYAPRPNILPDEDDLYGVVIEGTSMSRAFRPGDTAWLHPKYRERRDEACVFRRYNETTGDVSMTIKWLVDFNSTTWKVEQLNPYKEIELPRSEWPECYRVLGKKSRP